MPIQTPYIFVSISNFLSSNESLGQLPLNTPLPKEIERIQLCDPSFQWSIHTAYAF